MSRTFKKMKPRRHRICWDKDCEYCLGNFFYQSIKGKLKIISSFDETDLQIPSKIKHKIKLIKIK